MGLFKKTKHSSDIAEENRATIDQARKLLGYKSRSSLYYHVRGKRLTLYRTVLGRPFFDLEELKEVKRRYSWG